MMLADPQTSGGLLIAVAPEDAERLVAALRRHGTPAAALIGEILPGSGAIDVVA
jgi:selenide,water dikinase